MHAICGRVAGCLGNTTDSQARCKGPGLVGSVPTLAWSIEAYVELLDEGAPAVDLADDETIKLGWRGSHDSESDFGKPLGGRWLHQGGGDFLVQEVDRGGRRMFLLCSW